jgi:hypothetical protein
MPIRNFQKTMASLESATWKTPRPQLSLNQRAAANLAVSSIELKTQLNPAAVAKLAVPAGAERVKFVVTCGDMSGMWAEVPAGALKEVQSEIRKSDGVISVELKGRLAGRRQIDNVGLLVKKKMPIIG